MLTEIRRYLGAAILVCALTLLWGPAMITSPIWYLYAMILGVTLFIVGWLFRLTITSNSDFIAFKTSEPLGALAMFLPFLVKGYPETVTTRMLLGRRRSYAGITLLYGIGMVCLALICALIFFMESDGIGFALGWSAVIVVLSVSTIYSLTLAGIFSVSVAAVVYVVSFSQPQLSDLRLDLAVELAYYWALSAGCAIFALGIGESYDSRDRKPNRWISILAIAGLSIVFQTYSLMRFTAWVFELPALDLFDWLDTFATVSASTLTFLVVWLLAPVLTALLTRWVNRNESTSIFNLPRNSAQTQQGNYPDSLARPIIGAALGLLVLAGTLWLMVTQTAEDGSDAGNGPAHEYMPEQELRARLTKGCEENPSPWFSTASCTCIVDSFMQGHYHPELTALAKKWSRRNINAFTEVFPNYSSHQCYMDRG